ncbi:MAG: YhcH/YjgK/YiaL family protein [Candidatus Hydrogenedentes bacterium]|nr:YhcH/YjgK/YiaL family protein [Candidatus Hydrogenedentota bacterium]
MIHDELHNWRLYPYGPAWEAAFTFLESLHGDDEVRDLLPIQGDAVFARIMAYDTRTPEHAILEAHDRYVDIQMSLDGAERIGWYPRAKLGRTTLVDAEKDVTFFEYPGVSTAYLDNYPGVFTALFPDDAHMAQLQLGESPQPVKKVVVKVRRDMLLC